MKKRVLAAFLSMAMVAGLATGCGTPGGGKSDGDSADGKVFRYAVNTLPTTLDPTKGQSIGDNEIQHAVTEGLTRNTAGDVKPGIAESWDESEDGLTYTFHLRKDAKWSDGEPITAADFEYSWKRLVNPETASPYAFIGDCLKNGQAIEQGKMDVEELGVKAVDDTTLEVTLEHPTSYFLSLIGSSGQFAPLRQDIVEKYGTDFAATSEKNVYSGPFVMTSSEDNVWTFAKNDNYWDKDSINLDKCELNYVENTDTQLSMYEAGDLDYVQVPTAYVSDYKDKADVFANGNVDFCYINSKSDNPVLGNKNFRLALNYALNRNDYNKLANADTYTAFNGLVFPGLQAKGTTYGEAYDLNSYSYPLDGDQDKATEYLNAAMQELGIANASDITVEVVTTDADSSKRIVETLQEQWQNALGINVKIRQVTYADIYGKVFPEHDYEIGYGGWGSDYDDPYSYLELFKSDSSYNYSQYENPEVDQLLIASQDEPDTDKRMDELNQAEQDILADGAFVPLQARNVYYMLDDDTTGINFYYCSLNIDWVYADVNAK
ncbi:peptide ABC transporter substrate-binding protein [Dorea sp. AF36-15AT]|uniref:peptide ABC transporter substrate-binding protein n=1 Tax=Dorea sp. AF36-15AT TaxID=2292041 RepID=UPI000E49F74C|nr:peptide ABC transporter substrate-binding protein [Dorea sp. AF36-15AT]RHP06655.1 peptide ABC transporter substrate-binding protein [Dorea sp. AF36-15AT]